MFCLHEETKGSIIGDYLDRDTCHRSVEGIRKAKDAQGSGHWVSAMIAALHCTCTAFCLVSVAACWQRR